MLAEWAPVWRSTVNKAESDIANILEAGYEAVRKDEDKNQKVSPSSPWTSGSSDLTNSIDYSLEQKICEPDVSIRKRSLDHGETRLTDERLAAMSRQEQRFENFRLAQKALFEAETRLVKRLDDEMKATEEFNKMELELKRLLVHKATMVCGTVICISHT